MTDFAELADNLHSRPTRVEELIADEPAGIGAVDASGSGMGGVWFVPDMRPLVWRRKFNPSVQKNLVTATHPTGTVSNSDLELVGIVAHQDILAQHVDVDLLTFAIVGNNAASLVSNVALPTGQTRKESEKSSP